MSGMLVGLAFRCPKCGERIFLDYPDPFEMLSLHQSCMHWTCKECGEPIELTSSDILEKVYGNPEMYTGETTVRHPIARENLGGVWRWARAVVDAVRNAVKKL